MKKEIYCDGASVPNPGETACAVVKPGWGEVVFELGRGTNQTAELWALIHALEWAKPGDTIFTDSRYAVGMVAKNWKARANIELVEQARSLYRDTVKGTVKIKWMRGHKGHPHQERVDKLANEAAASAWRKMGGR